MERHHDTDNTTVPQTNSDRESTTVNGQTELHPTTAREAVQLYLDSREGEASASTVQSHEYRLNHFIRWCDQENLQNLNRLNGRDLYEYKIWRRNDGELKPLSLKTQMSTIRTFVRFLETVEAVPQGLHEKIVLPTLNNGARTRDTILTATRASDILTYLRKFEYASRDHTLLEVLWSTGMRVGEAHALDVDDFHPRNNSIDVVHRPRGATPLKNKKNGERPVALSDTVTDAISDFISHKRPDTTDEYDRDPLFCSQYGRIPKSRLRKIVYRVTQPCLIGDCPHGRDPDKCEAVGYRGGSGCPSTVSPHDIRRGCITDLKNNDVPDEVVSDRTNVSQKVLKEHYDKRTPDEKMEIRRQYLDKIER